MMKKKLDFFDNINYYNIINNVKNIMLSDGSMSVLLDFERTLDDCDLYAYENWDLGELVDGPNIKKYTVSCIFMWPYKLMPNPKGALRLIKIGCRVKLKLTKIKVPIKVENYDDFMPGTHYPKLIEKKVWLIYIEMPKEIMDDIREGSVDLAGQSVDLDELDDSYDDDLDTEQVQNDSNNNLPSPMPSLGGGPDLGGPGPLGTPPGQGGLI